MKVFLFHFILLLSIFFGGGLVTCKVWIKVPYTYLIMPILCHTSFVKCTTWPAYFGSWGKWLSHYGVWREPLGLPPWIIFMWFFGVLPLTSSISTIMHPTPIAFMMLSSFKRIVSGAITIHVSNATRWGVTGSADPKSMIYLQKCISCCIINL